MIMPAESGLQDAPSIVDAATLKRRSLVAHTEGLIDRNTGTKLTIDHSTGWFRAVNFKLIADPNNVGTFPSDGDDELSDFEIHALADRWDLFHRFVHEECRGAGLGSQMMSMIERYVYQSDEAPPVISAGVWQRSVAEWLLKNGFYSRDGEVELIDRVQDTDPDSIHTVHLIKDLRSTDHHRRSSASVLLPRNPR